MTITKNKISYLKIKLLSAITVLTAVLIFGYAAFAATDSTSITSEFTIDGTCNWAGVPFQSNLTVADDEVCVLEGTHDTTGYTVDILVNGDANSNGVGGTLLIGPTSATTTAITVDAILNYGKIEIGSATNANSASLLTKAGKDLTILDNDASGYVPSLTTVSNTTAGIHNLIKINGNLYVGTEATLATINDGNLNLLDASGSNEITHTSYGKTYVLGSGSLTNDATFSTYQLMLGQYTGNKQGGTINNNGTFNSTFNTAYVAATPGSQIHRGTFNNNATGTVTITNTIRLTEDTQKGTLVNKGTFNTQYLRIGDQASNYNGGSVSNVENGIFNITYAASYAFYVYKGEFYNWNTNDYSVAPASLNIAGYLTIQGDATEYGIVENKGVVNDTNNLYIQQYGHLNLFNGVNNGGIDSSRWVSTGSASLYGTNQTNNGTINIGDGTTSGDLATLSVTALYIGANDATPNGGTVLNYGKIRRVDLAGTVLPTTTLTINMYNFAFLTNKSTGIISTYTATLSFGARSTAGRPVATITNDAGGQFTGSGITYVYADVNNANDTVFNNSGTFSMGGLYIGSSTVPGGTFNNLGTGTVTLSGSLIVDQGAAIDNQSSASPGVAVTGSTYIYNRNSYRGLLHNLGTITGTVLRVGYVTSPMGGDYQNHGTASYTSSTTIAQGGIFTNESDGIFSTTGLIVGETTTNSPACGNGLAEFRQLERTSSSSVKTTLLSTSGFTIADCGKVTNWDSIQLGTGALSVTSYLPYGTSSDYGYYAQNTANSVLTGGNSASAVIYGNFILAALSSYEARGSVTIGTSGSYKGIVVNDGTIWHNPTTDASQAFTVGNASGPGEYWSGTNSTLTLDDTSGNDLEVTNATVNNDVKIEIQGNLTTNSTAPLIVLNSGRICFGSATFGGDLSDCARTNKTYTLGAFTGAAYAATSATAIYVANDIAFTNGATLSSGNDGRTTTLTTTSDSNIAVQNNTNFSMTNSGTVATVNGDFDIIGTAGATGLLSVTNGAYAKFLNASTTYNFGSIYMMGSTDATPPDTKIDIGDATHKPTVYLTDYQACGLGGGNCVIELNNTATGSTNFGKAILKTYGDINIDYAVANPKTYIGGTATTVGQGILDIKDDAGGTNAFTNYMTASFYVNKSGRINIDYTSGTQYSTFHLASSFYTYSEGIANGVTPSDDNRGVNVAGVFECTDTLQVGDSSNTAAMDVLNSGTVNVLGNPNNAQAIIYRTLELDGSLNVSSGNYGYVQVNSTGEIRSGGIDHPTGQSSSNFIINTYYLDVNSGGKISSNGVSARLPSSDGSGSNAGEGEGRSGGATLADNIKFNMDTLPYDTAPYGESGRSSGAVDAKGGGAVRINLRGYMYVAGTISANGADSTNTGGGAGAGGTVIIKHIPTHTSSTEYEITGSGYITANGGNSSTTGVPVGGGGKIYIDSIFLDRPDNGTYTEYTFNTSHINAYGGANSTDSDYAAAGAIVFVGDTNNPDGTLIVDQGSGRAATSGEITFIQDVGNTTFDRIEANNGAQIIWNATAVDPVVCYELNSGYVDLNSTSVCSDFNLPDKPHTVYVNNSYAGAQSGSEPSNIGPNTIYDATPVFSAVLLNPESPTQNITKIEIQVDDTETFASPVWDGTVDLTTLYGGTAIQEGDRSVDVEYAGPALSTNTTYYFRTRFLGTGDDPGLWNHRDWQNQYQFEIDGNFLSLTGCTGTRSILDTNAAGRTIGSNLRMTNGDRYGYDSCVLTLNAPAINWYLKYGMAPGQTNFTDGTNNLVPVTNASATCDFTIDSTGNTEHDEYGFNLTGSIEDTAVPADPEATTCSQTYYYNDTTPQHYFDIEASGGEDTIMYAASAPAMVDETITLNNHVNIEAATVPGTYTLYTRAILTDTP